MEGLNANDLLLFARVVDAGSFSRAAERMGVPKSTVSRRIAALEDVLKERLFHRSTRKLSLTDFGLNLLEHARALAAELDNARDFAQHRQARPSGRLKVSVPGDLSRVVLPQVLASFVEKYPDITLEIDTSPRRVDLIGENYDLALRIGSLPDDSLLAVRKLADLHAGLYCSPTYLKGVNEPTRPEELLQLHGLLVKPTTSETRGWTLVRSEGSQKERWEGIPVRYTLANSPMLLMDIAEEGVGVACLPHFVAVKAVARGTLRRILPEWEQPVSAYSAVFPGRRLMPARTRAFLDALIESTRATQTDW